MEDTEFKSAVFCNQARLPELELVHQPTHKTYTCPDCKIFRGNDDSELRLLTVAVGVSLPFLCDLKTYFFPLESLTQPGYEGLFLVLLNLVILWYPCEFWSFLKGFVEGRRWLCAWEDWREGTPQLGGTIWEKNKYNKVLY